MNDKRIKSVMAAVFEVPPSEIDESTTPARLEKWDSLNHIKLVMALEDEFGVKFKEGEIVELQSFKLIRLMLGEKLAG
jgi:acyl carrier protein